jgi:hypothetical protein
MVAKFKGIGRFSKNNFSIDCCPSTQPKGKVASHLGPNECAELTAEIPEKQVTHFMIIKLVKHLNKPCPH